MGKGQQNIISNEDRVMMTKTFEEEMKKRSRHAKGLRKGDPRSLEWAAKVGLKHWHAVGFGCGKHCLRGAGKQEDPDRLNHHFFTPHAGQSYHGTEEKDPERLARKEQIRKVAARRGQTDKRLRREGLIP